MDYITKIKCVVCGAVMAGVLVGESFICHECDHLSLHVPRQGFTGGNSFSPTYTISGGVPDSSIVTATNTFDSSRYGL